MGHPAAATTKNTTTTTVAAIWIRVVLPVFSLSPLPLLSQAAAAAAHSMGPPQLAITSRSDVYCAVRF